MIKKAEFLLDGRNSAFLIIKDANDRKFNQYV